MLNNNLSAQYTWRVKELESYLFKCQGDAVPHLLSLFFLRISYAKLQFIQILKAQRPTFLFYAIFGFMQFRKKKILPLPIYARSSIFFT